MLEHCGPTPLRVRSCGAPTSLLEWMLLGHGLSHPFSRPGLLRRTAPPPCKNDAEATKPASEETGLRGGGHILANLRRVNPMTHLHIRALRVG